MFGPFPLECEPVEPMGILDEAIREHLELRRQHGAEQDELRQLEGEAFGPADRPAVSDEAPTTIAGLPDRGEAGGESARAPGPDARGGEGAGPAAGGAATSGSSAEPG